MIVASAGSAFSLFLLALAAQLPAITIFDGRCFRQEIALEQEGDETVWCLAGVAAPGPVALPEEEAGLAAAGRAALAMALSGKQLAFTPHGAPDRWGRQNASVHADGAGEPVQLALLRAGHVHIVPRDLPPAHAGAMRAAQSEAQAARRGLWASPASGVLYADEAAQGIDQVRFVRGRVLYAYAGRDWTYLNFGADWRSDFTIMIKPRLARALAEAGFDAMALEGRLVEIYGPVHDENGPAVELTDGADIWIVPERD